MERRVTKVAEPRTVLSVRRACKGQAACSSGGAVACGQLGAVLRDGQMHEVT